VGAERRNQRQWQEMALRVARLQELAIYLSNKPWRLREGSLPV